MAAASPTARALRDLQKTIRRHSGAVLGDVAQRAVRDHVDDYEVTDRVLTAWLWSDLGDVSPASFMHSPSERHSMLGMATLYSLRTAPTAIERLALTSNERRLVRRARFVVAELSGVPELTARHWRHLAGLEASPLEFTFKTAQPGTAAAALCWEPGLEQTAVWAPGTLGNLRTHFDAAEVAAAVIHEEMHLALSLRARRPSDGLTPLVCEGLELAAEVAQAAAALSSRRQQLTLDAMLDYLRLEAWVAAPIVEMLPKRTSVGAAAAAMVALSTAAQESEESFLTAAQLRVDRSLTRRRLERLFGLA